MVIQRYANGSNERQAKSKDPLILHIKLMTTSFTLGIYSYACRCIIGVLFSSFSASISFVI